MKITIADFAYTKTDGTTRQRKAMIVSRPSDSYLTIEVEHDLTELSNYLKYRQELEEIELALKKKYGLDNKNITWKRFSADGVSFLNEETLDIDANRL